MPMTVQFTPIGVVRNDIGERWVAFEEVESNLEIDPRYREALEGLEEFSHIIVVFWLHRSQAPDSLKTHPERREELPLVGLFATRSRARPNLIGVTVAQLLERRGATLRVRGLDAFDGTPILDIKPYLPGDVATDARFPPWALQLHREHTTPKEKRP